MVDPNVPFTAVRASRGKYIRAEPVAALFEQNKIHLVGNFPHLEDQLTNFVPDLDRGKSGSPDRADSMIWALTELVVEREPFAALFQWYEQKTAQLRVSGAGAAPQNGAEVSSLPVAAVILHARPYTSFQAASGRRYVASETGVIEVADHEDARDLQRAGCTATGRL